MARKKSPRGKKVRKSRKRTKPSYACVECRSKESGEARVECSLCGEGFCSECEETARQCEGCGDRVCSACEDIYFTGRCDLCERPYHEECDHLLRCSHCFTLACDDCGTSVELCVDCDLGAYCDACGGRSLSDDGYALGACSGCDIKRPAEAAVKKWVATRRLTDEALAGAVLFWRPEVVGNMAVSGDFANSIEAGFRESCRELLIRVASGRSSRFQQSLKQTLPYLDASMRADLEVALAPRPPSVSTGPRKRGEATPLVHEPFVRWTHHRPRPSGAYGQKRRRR